MCGGVRYELTAPPEYALYCHCTRCQRRTGGSASVSARVARGSFSVASGAQLVEHYRPEQGYEKAFCSSCESALWSRNPDNHNVPDDGLSRYPDRGHPDQEAAWT